MAGMCITFPVAPLGASAVYFWPTCPATASRRGNGSGPAHAYAPLCKPAGSERSRAPLNEQFTALSRNGSFATAVLTTFFAPTRRLSLCNAGHPRPLLFRASDSRWSLLGHGHDHPEKKGLSNIPLGMFQIADYEQLDLELEPGDCLVSYTDALMESCDADGEMLGEEGLLRIVKLLGNVPGEKIIPALLQEISERFPENLAADDVSLLVLRANGRSLDFSFREKLDAFGRFVKTLFRSLNPQAERAPFPDANLANMGGVIIPALARRWRAPRPGLK